MPSQRNIVVGAAAVLAVAGLGVLNGHRLVEAPAGVENIAEQKAAPAPRAIAPIPSPTPPPIETNRPAHSGRQKARLVPEPIQPEPNPAPPVNAEAPTQDPDARAALSLVGVDPNATGIGYEPQ